MGQFSFNVRYIRYPFLVWSFGIKFLSVQVLIAIMKFLSANNRQQVVLLHYTKNSFRVVVYFLSFKPYMYSAITVCSVTFLLTFSYLFG